MQWRTVTGRYDLIFLSKKIKVFVYVMSRVLIFPVFWKNGLNST